LAITRRLFGLSAARFISFHLIFFFFSLLLLYVLVPNYLPPQNVDDSTHSSTTAKSQQTLPKMRMWALLESQTSGFHNKI